MLSNVQSHLPRPFSFAFALPFYCACWGPAMYLMVCHNFSFALCPLKCPEKALCITWMASEYADVFWQHFDHLWLPQTVSPKFPDRIPMLQPLPETLIGKNYVPQQLAHLIALWVQSAGTSSTKSTTYWHFRSNLLALGNDRIALENMISRHYEHNIIALKTQFPDTLSY